MIRWIALLLATVPPPGPGAHESPAIVASAAWVVIPTSELVAAYDTVWAISDVHGRLAQLENLLLAAKLAVRTPSGALEWNRAASRQLLVVVGDCIDGGEDSVGVVLLLKTLQEQSAASRSRVVVLLGNHEVAFLADPASATAELIASAMRAGLGPRSGLTSSQLYESEFGRYLKRLPAGAVIGTWLFAHAGYIDAEPERLALRA